MAEAEVEYSQQAVEQLEALEQEVAERIVSKLDDVVWRPNHYLTCLTNSPYYRLRVGDYRAVIDWQRDETPRYYSFVRLDTDVTSTAEVTYSSSCSMFSDAGRPCSRRCCLTKSVALGYASRKIRVNAIAPGPTNIQANSLSGGTDPRSLPFDTSAMTDVPMGRVADPEEMAGAAAFLCSDDTSYITGHTFPVDGGQAAD